MTIAEEIEQLKKNIRYAEQELTTYSEFPTNTAQYYRALERDRQKLSDMRVKLEELEAINK